MNCNKYRQRSTKPTLTFIWRMCSSYFSPFLNLCCSFSWPTGFPLGEVISASGFAYAQHWVYMEYYLGWTHIMWRNWDKSHIDDHPGWDRCTNRLSSQGWSCSGKLPTGLRMMQLGNWHTKRLIKNNLSQYIPPHIWYVFLCIADKQLPNWVHLFKNKLKPLPVNTWVTVHTH